MDETSFQQAIETNDPDLARKGLAEIDCLLRLATDPKEKAYLLFSKSSCYGILGNFKEARELLSSALRLQPEDPNTRLTFEFNSVLLLQQEGKYQEALDTFTIMLSSHAEMLTDPGLRFMFEEIQQRRAFLSATLRQFQSAIPLFQEMLSFDINTDVRSDALSSLGRCYLEIHDWVPARDCFLQAARIGITKEREKTFHFFLGIAYFYAGPLYKAKVEFQLCEKRAADYEAPLLDVYAWLSSTCKRLGETFESEEVCSVGKTNMKHGLLTVAFPRL